MPSKNKTTQAAAPVPDRGAFLLFIFALGLRLLGLGWGIPNEQHYYSYHPDEFFVVRPALGMLQGDWNPHFFNYGALYLYLIGFAGKLLAELGFSPGAGGLGSLHIIARIITALLGAGTVLLVYGIGRQIGNRSLALIAGLLLALTPLHLINSHYATVDVPGTFFLLLGAAASVQIISTGKLRWYLLAVAAIGLAAATKYPLGAGLLLPFAAHFLRRGLGAKEHLKLLTLLAFPLCFLAGCPYALDFTRGLHLRKEFLEGLLFEVGHMGEYRTPAFVGTGSGWSYHALRGFPAALGIPLYLLALAGLLPALAWRLVKNSPLAARSYFLFALWSVVFFLIIGRATERFVRYLVPFTPFLALLAAAALQKLTTEISGRGRQWLIAGVGAALALNTIYAFSQEYLLLKTDPRDRALQAFLARPPESVGLEMPPWFWVPPISPVNAGWFSAAVFEEWRAQAPYRVIVTGWETASLLREKPQNYVISDLQYDDLLRLGDPGVREFLAALANNYNDKASFSNPTPFDWLGGGKRREPPDWLYLKPTVAIYSGWRRTESN
jgi:4-amino-4-deoxy-L-arabinose transferase-like glycosyltransferase